MRPCLEMAAMKLHNAEKGREEPKGRSMLQTRWYLSLPRCSLEAHMIWTVGTVTEDSGDRADILRWDYKIPQHFNTKYLIPTLCNLFITMEQNVLDVTFCLPK